MITSLHIHFSMIASSSALQNNVADNYRIIIYVDKQANGAAATASDILQTPVSFEAFRNLENSQRFRVLKDKRIAFGSRSTIGAASARNVLSSAINIKCRCPIEFSGATGGLIEIRSNNIGVLIVSRASAPSCTINYVSRIRYTD